MSSSQTRTATSARGKNVQRIVRGVDFGGPERTWEAEARDSRTPGPCKVGRSTETRFRERFSGVRSRRPPSIQSPPCRSTKAGESHLSGEFGTGREEGGPVKTTDCEVRPSTGERKSKGVRTPTVGGRKHTCLWFPVSRGSQWFRGRVPNPIPPSYQGSIPVPYGIIRLSTGVLQGREKQRR